VRVWRISRFLAVKHQTKSGRRPPWQQLCVTHAKRMSVASSCHGSAVQNPDAAPEVEGSTMTGGKSGFGDE
jgi:hypothetical protein